MTILRVNAILPELSGLPRDIVVNSWYFIGTDNEVTMAGEAADRLDAFYTGITAWRNTDGYNFPGAIYQIYNEEDTPPRIPGLIQSDYTATGPGSGLPSEVAACLSYHENLAGGGIPTARKKGRIFIGALDSGVISLTGNRIVLDDDFVASLTTAAEALLTANTAGTTWAFHSPTRGTYNAIVGGWVDNAFDTQRRRGTDSTSRVLWP